MEEREIRSLSENDITPDPGQKDPIPGTEPGEGETPPQEEGQEPVTDPETPPGNEGQDPGPGENTEPPATEPPTEETGGGTETPSADTMQQILDDLRETLGKKETDVTTLVESVQDLVDAVSANTLQASDIYIPPEIPIEGYEGWAYPVTVDYLVKLVGFEDAVPQTEEYPSPDVFLEDYQGIAKECFIGSTFKDFVIEKITDAGGNVVYEKTAETPEPDPGDEEQKETAELLLTHLENINTTLEGMVQADLEYRQATADYQDQMLKMQAAGTATNIFICIGVFAIFAAMIWQQFLGRFK